MIFYHSYSHLSFLFLGKLPTGCFKESAAPRNAGRDNNEVDDAKGKRGGGGTRKKAAMVDLIIAANENAKRKDELVELAILNELVMKRTEEFIWLQEKTFEVGRALMEECGGSIIYHCKE